MAKIRALVKIGSLKVKRIPSLICCGRERPLHLISNFMKKSILLVAVPLFIGCQSGTQETTDQVENQVEETVAENDHTGHDHAGHDHHDHADHEQSAPGAYGGEMSKDGAMSTDKMMALMEGKEELNCKLKAEVVTSCKKKGCWMDVKMEDGSTMKVTFKDYGFFVPKEGLGGKTVYMEGKAVREEVSVDVLKHYAEDAGMSEEEIAAITEPEEGISFVADAVIIEE